MTARFFRTTPGGRPLLGGADRILLDRLRAVALLLRHDRHTALVSIRIALTVDAANRPCLLPFDGSGAYPLLARAAGRDDLLGGRTTLLSEVEAQMELLRLNAAAALDHPCPDGLLRLLRRIVRGGRALADADLAALARAGWAVHPLRHLFPRLPLQVSAHEALDALARADAGGGLGIGPLAVLADAARRRLGQGGGQ